MVRTFLAINPSAEVLERIEDFQRELRESGADVRWVAPTAMHMTVQFLGEVREEEIPGIERGLVESFRDEAAAEVEFHGSGVFPNLRKPRVLWVGLSGDGLSRISERAETALSPLGFPPEEREFRPHLTLGRLRSMRGWDRLLPLLKANGDRRFGTTRVAEIVLYRSDLRPSGAVYTPLARLPLGSAVAND